MTMTNTMSTTSVRRIVTCQTTNREVIKSAKGIKSTTKPVLTLPDLQKEKCMRKYFSIIFRRNILNPVRITTTLLKSRKFMIFILRKKPLRGRSEAKRTACVQPRTIRMNMSIA